MKRTISLLIALVLCLSLAVPVFADEFVPSITGKPAPEIVPVLDPDGNEAIGEILNQDGEVIGYLYEECLVITPVSPAKTSTEIPEDAAELLLSVYDQLVAGTMNLPYEKFNANLDPSTMVIKDLFDVSWLCGPDNADMVGSDHPDHPAMVAPLGVTIRLIFDLDVAKNVNVYSMSYKNGAGNPIVKCVNNGDGTVSATFEDFCPVSFSLGSTYNTPPASTGDNTQIHLWLIVMAVSVVAMGAVLVLNNRKTAC